MSEIRNRTSISINDFISDIYQPNKKPVIFWDTCSLLEIIRFLYRKGDVNSYKTLNKINGLIQSNLLHSIASSLTIIEWNNHQKDVLENIESSLEKTEYYHRNCIETINEINTTTYLSESISDKNLLEDLERLADDILSRTIFIETEEIADKALDRVSLKRAPANKKNEFKDCAVWETMILVSERINEVNQPDDNYNKIFYSVNTDDFIDKSREPKIFYATLLSEASVVDLICCSNLIEVDSKL